MANQPEYICTRCWTPTPREELSVKRVQFVDMGPGGATLRSTVLGWLCIKCREEDIDFNLPRFIPPKGQTVRAS